MNRNLQVPTVSLHFSFKQARNDLNKFLISNSNDKPTLLDIWLLHGHSNCNDAFFNLSQMVFEPSLQSQSLDAVFQMLQDIYFALPSVTDYQ